LYIKTFRMSDESRKSERTCLKEEAVNPAGGFGKAEFISGSGTNTIV
jgi:hypothetical protein